MAWSSRESLASREKEIAPSNQACQAKRRGRRSRRKFADLFCLDRLSAFSCSFSPAEDKSRGMREKKEAIDINRSIDRSIAGASARISRAEKTEERRS
jgi:hypothetical protein